MIQLRFVDGTTKAIDDIGQLQDYGFTSDMLAAPDGDGVMLFNAEDCTVLVMDIDTYNLWTQTNETI